MVFKLVNSLSEILAIRHIRNECREYLTNDTGYISIPQQIYWYFTYHKRAAKSGKYRIYLARDDKGNPVGYGALHLIDRELLITECVAEKFRRQGYGYTILKKLITIAEHKRLPLVAEIRATNKISIALHKKCGFILEKTGVKSGFKLLTFRKEK